MTWPPDIKDLLKDNRFLKYFDLNLIIDGVKLIIVVIIIIGGFLKLWYGGGGGPNNGPPGEGPSTENERMASENSKFNPSSG